MILEGEIMDAKMSSFFLHEKLMSLRSTVSTVAQKCHGNFNFTHGNFNLLTAISTLLTAISILLTAISILLTAISIYSRQFRSFTHGNFNFTHGDFNFTHGNFNFLTATLTAFFASLTTCQLRRPTETKSMAGKTQNQKWIVKVDLQREKWKSQSKVDLRTSRTRGYLHETGTNSDWCEFVSVAIHFFSCIYLTENELRPVWLHLGRWPDTSYFRAGLRPYRSHTKQKSDSVRAHK